MRPLNTREDVSKKVPNSSILIYNHELDTIEVNKGRNQGELSYF